MFVVRGSSSTANVKDVQFRVLLRADDAGNAPEVFGLNFTYKKSSYSVSEAVYTGKTSAGALPKSASVDITATSAYGIQRVHHYYRCWVGLCSANSRK